MLTKVKTHAMPGFAVARDISVVLFRNAWHLRMIVFGTLFIPVGGVKIQGCTCFTVEACRMSCCMLCFFVFQRDWQYLSKQF